MYFKLVVVSVLNCAALMGCGVAQQVESRQINSATMRLEIGMTKEQVLSLMGIPDRREAYGPTEYLIFRTDAWAASEPLRFTPVALVDGKVVG